MNTTTKNSTDATIHLVLGSARSGKSRFAEQEASKLSNVVSYIATAQMLDGEMSERIKQHVQDRPAHWLTIEEPLNLAKAVLNASQQYPDQPILIDCLTLWVTNCLLHSDELMWPRQRADLLELLPQLHTPIFLVSNEVGWGIVPMGELSRRFVDESGRLHQAIAAIAHDVTLLVAGIPMAVKRS